MQLVNTESTEIQKGYIEVLETYDLNNHISKATWIRKKLIDHIISANRILHSDVLPSTTISDQDAPYIIANMPANKFETRYKYIRNLKNFKLEKYVQYFRALAISLNTLNNLMNNEHAINERAPLTKTKFTRPPAAWMKDF